MSENRLADVDWLTAALAAANVPTLACVLVHLTGDRLWIEGRFVPTRLRGMDDNDCGGLPDEVQDEIRSAAEVALRAWFAGQPPALPDPAGDLLVEMMSVSLGEQVPVDYAPMIWNDLFVSPTLDELRSDVPPPEGFSVLIIGAGISGLCAAIELAEAGIPSIILERRHELGGVWFDNRYPGAACDVPSISIPSRLRRMTGRVSSLAAARSTIISIRLLTIMMSGSISVSAAK